MTFVARQLRERLRRDAIQWRKRRSTCDGEGRGDAEGREFFLDGCLLCAPFHRRHVRLWGGECRVLLLPTFPRASRTRMCWLWSRHSRRRTCNAKTEENAPRSVHIGVGTTVYWTLCAVQHGRGSRLPCRCHSSLPAYCYYSSQPWTHRRNPSLRREPSCDHTLR